jgi:PAS domain S-box-containing protein
MRVSSKLAVQLFEACDAVGIAREELASALSPESAAALEKPRGTMEWEALILLFDRLWIIVDADVERMRAIGGALVHAPSYVLLRRLAYTAVSARSLYGVATRWIAPATLPHVSLEQAVLSSSRLRLVGSIPKPHASSEAFWHFFEGVLIELPRLLALGRSTIVASAVTPRTIEVVIDLPGSSSVLGRVRHVVRAALTSADTIDLLEGQRSELASGLQAVRRGASEIQEVFDRLPVLVVIHSKGTILWTNRAATQTLGYEGLVGREVFDLLEPSARETFRARMRAPAEQTPDLQEVRLVKRDGEVVVTEVFPTQVVTFDGKPARMIVGHDATERVRLQQQLLVAARMASIGMLAAGVAHEVNNPLAYVLNNVEIAMKQLAPLGEATRQGREALGVALEGVDRIRTIVRDLLALSRVNDVPIGPIDVPVVVESTLALARKEIAERAQLVYEHEPVALSRGTVARLGQVLLNLVANALEAMPEGARVTNELRVVVRPSAFGGAIVEVSDNGVGIPAEHCPRLFDPFFTTKAPGLGTGLGLSITQRLVSEMGGELSFESVVKRGSTFRVTLPPADLDEPAPPSA